MRFRPGLLTVSLILALSGAPSRAQEGPGATSPVQEIENTGDDKTAEKTEESTAEGPADPEKKQRRITWVPLAYPTSNPTIGTGLIGAIMAVYSIGATDPEVPPSSTILGGGYYDSGSWFGGLVQETHLAGDRFRLDGTLGGARLNYDFYGIGNDAGDRGLGIPISQDGYGFTVKFKGRVARKTYLGLRYSGIKFDTRIDLDEFLKDAGIVPPDFELPEISRDQVLSGTGPILQFDTRDHRFFPQSGQLIDFSAMFNFAALGSDFKFQKYEFAYNWYHSLTERQVLAVRATACGVGGEVPFYQLCLYGSSGDLRGYAVGRYQDRTMLSAQIEWRWMFWRWLGGAVFAGTGQVGERFRDYTTANLLSSAGLGLRFRISKERKINIRIDYAVGEGDANAWYLGIGEAF